MIQFRRREILFIFIMLVGVTSAVFGVGIYMGHEIWALKQEAKRDEGLELVMAEPVQKEPLASSVPQTESKPLTGYTIQVSLLDEFEKAQAELEKMKGLGFPSVFLHEAHMDGRTWYVLDLGYFGDENPALKLAERLKSKGLIDRYLIRKTSDLPK